MAKTPKNPLAVESLRHTDASRRNIPTAEFESLVPDADKTPLQVAFERRNQDLDPQLVWRGKDNHHWSDLIVQAPPLYIQEKIHPQALIDALRRETAQRARQQAPAMDDLFGDFNGLPDLEARTEFYQHDQHWSNRMILGDSLSVMASLAEREGLRGKVQCIYFDPPYGIKFNSNFQWSTTSRDVKDGDRSHVTREPEQVRAFRDTWRDGIHSYLSYLRDRLTVARDLLTESGSIFVQIGDENVHRVRAVMDEVFGDDNFVSEIVFLKTSGAGSPSIGTNTIAGTYDVIVWYAKLKSNIKYHQIYKIKKFGEEGTDQYKYHENESGERAPIGGNPQASLGKIFRYDQFTSQTGADSTRFNISIGGRKYSVVKGGWKTNFLGAERLVKSSRLHGLGNTLTYVRYLSDFSVFPVNNFWSDTRQSGFGEAKRYVVQTSPKVIERCLLMATDPGDLVLDPTCGSGTTAYVAEQWGRRWITIDTSRVALALARARLMGARYPYYLLADSTEGQRKEGEITRRPPARTPTYGQIRLGFVYERVPHITLKSIANNAEIDVLWDKWQAVLEPLRADLNHRLGQNWQEWQIPRSAAADWPAEASAILAQWWQARIARQQEIDASIAARADTEYLYDKPYSDPARIRVAGPFTVESLSPLRSLGMGIEGELIDEYLASEKIRTHKHAPERPSFIHMILDNLRTAGVQQADKDGKITFDTVTPWPGRTICGEGRFLEGEVMRRTAILIGPEFGTVARADLVAAAREASDAGFDLLVACAFSYDAHCAEFSQLGRMPVLKARMNPDLHMAQDLKATSTGNLFVIFGEPDIEIIAAPEDQIQVKIHGIDVFKPQTGEIVSGGPDSIALWMIDTDYNEESFFVRHAYFLGANDPYDNLKKSLKAEIDAEAWASLRRDISRPFAKPSQGRIAVKVINHLGDEVMKVFAVR